MPCYALGVEYLGASYNGWQRQNNAVSVQEELEKALSFVANEPVSIICAGRTDTGVHGTGQVVSFMTNAIRPDKAWVLGVNTRLPSDIRSMWVQSVSEDFSARFTATARSYRYVILNSMTASAILDKRVTHHRYELDAHAMHAAAQVLLGENDFTSFRSSDCQSHTPFRFMESIVVQRKGIFIYIDIKANAFLHHMVRNIVGSLMNVGRGEKPIGWIAEILAAKDRNQAGITAPPDGLYLVAVEYPAEFQLPPSGYLPQFN